MVENKELSLVQGQYGLGDAIEHALMKNDFGRLTPDDKVVLYKRVCESVGLNPYTQPFGFYRQKDGSEKMYAQRNCADQLRFIHGVSLLEMREEHKDDIFSVIVTMQTRDGRKDIDRGDVFVAGLKGVDLANARMRAMTKAKRRCTLSICGLGWLDESEVQDAPQLKAIAQKTSQEKVELNLRDRLREAFAKRVKSTGVQAKDLAKSITDKFGVADLVNLDEAVAKEVLEWLNG